MNDDDAKLQDLWQSAPTVDINALLSHVARERRRMLLFALFEAAAAIGIVIMVIVFDALGHLGPRRWAIWAIVIFSLLAQVWMWWRRRGLWSASSKAPRELLTLQLARARSGLKLGWYYAVGSPACGVLGFLIAPFLSPKTSALDLSGSARVLILAGLCAMIVAMTAWGVRAIYRYRADISSLEQQLAEFDAKPE